MRVGFDLDGVGYNFGDSVKRYLDATDRGHIWKSGPTEQPFWDFYKDWGWTGEQFVQMCNEGADAGYIFTGPVRDNFVDAVRRVAELGHEIIIITDRGFGKTRKVSEDHTVEWLRQHGIEYDELHFSADKTSAHTHMFVEDKLENYDALVAAGVHTFLINRPWNLVDGGDARFRINDVKDYADFVEEYTRLGYFDNAFA